jgi:hypothetical protein
MFNSFGEFDDEGYMLIALKAFAHHGGLYTHVFSQYGPFYFEVFSTIFSWLPITHDSGRMASLVVWLLASLGFGVAIKMFTENLLVGIATQVGSFVLLLSLAVQPMHPSGLVCLLFAVTLIALALVARGRRSLGFTVLGATVAALVLTEVNVGALAAIAMLFTGFALARPVRAMRLPRAAAALLLVATPLLVIVVAGRHTTESWEIEYALIVAAAAAAVVVMTLDRGSQGLVDRSDAYRFLLSGSVVGVLVVVIAFLSGTRPADLIRGVLIDPARQANAFTFPLLMPVWVDVWGAVCIAVAIWYRRYRRRNSPIGLLGSCVSLFAGLLIVYYALAPLQVWSRYLGISATFGNLSLVGVSRYSFTGGLPLLFVAVIPPVGATESERTARVAVVALAVVESLIGYPVAGSQVSWASLLIVPAGMLCLHDGVRQLRPALALARRRGHRAAVSLATSVAVLAGTAWLVWVFLGNLSDSARAYNADTPSTLPGSGMIRIPAAENETLESLSQAIHARCSTFVTLPGMNSLYFWAQETPPTWFNATDWMNLFESSQQEEIVHDIDQQKPSRFCVVDNPDLLYFWDFYAAGPEPQAPFVRLIEQFESENGAPKVIDGFRLFVAHGSAP